MFSKSCTKDLLHVGKRFVDFQIMFLINLSKFNENTYTYVLITYIFALRSVSGKCCWVIHVLTIVLHEAQIIFLFKKVTFSKSRSKNVLNRQTVTFWCYILMLHFDVVVYTFIYLLYKLTMLWFIYVYRLVIARVM